MADNIALGQQLPAGVFDPQPDPAALPRNLIIGGVYISSSAILSALRPPPHFVGALDMYIVYNIALAVIALLGVGMILIGWMVSDAPPDRHASLVRITVRVSHILLIFAFALHQFASTSTKATETDAPTK